MADEANIQRILEYLRTHAEQYDLESLRQQLLGAGYAAEEVAAAIDRFTGAPAAAPATAVLPPASPTIVLPEAERSALPPSSPSPPLSPDPEETIARITAYLNQHRGSYEVGALRGQVLAAGYPPELVEVALSRMAQAPTPAPVDQTSFRSAWLPGCGIWLINIVVGLILAAVAAAIDEEFIFVVGWLTPLLLIGELVGGFVLRNQGRPRLGNALIWGVIHSIFTSLLLGLLLGALVFLLISACIQLFGG